MRKVALITGASRGLGRAMALAFGAAGYNVGINYLHDEAAALETLRLVAESGGSGLCLRADVADAADVKKMFASVRDTFGALHVLINNAGIVDDVLLLKMTEESWDRVIAADLRSVFLCCREAVAQMKKSGGHIVNVSSISGVCGRAGQANYAAAKAGVIAFTSSLAQEVGRFGIKVNAVAPGFLETDMNAPLPDDVRELHRRQSALDRFTSTEEVARFVCQLTEFESFTGQTFIADSRIGFTPY